MSLLQRWLEACLSVEVPPASELEGALRNGVIVARLSRFFKPEAVKKIYDEEEKVYRVRVARRRLVFCPVPPCFYPVGLGPPATRSPCALYCWYFLPLHYGYAVFLMMCAVV